MVKPEFICRSWSFPLQGAWAALLVTRHVFCHCVPETVMGGPRAQYIGAPVKDTDPKVRHQTYQASVVVCRAWESVLADGPAILGHTQVWGCLLDAARVVEDENAVVSGKIGLSSETLGSSVLYGRPSACPAAQRAHSSLPEAAGGSGRWALGIREGHGNKTRFPQRLCCLEPERSPRLQHRLLRGHVPLSRECWGAELKWSLSAERQGPRDGRSGWRLPDHGRQCQDSSGSRHVPGPSLWWPLPCGRLCGWAPGCGFQPRAGVLCSLRESQVHLD